MKSHIHPAELEQMWSTGLGAVWTSLSVVLAWWEGALGSGFPPARLPADLHFLPEVAALLLFPCLESFVCILAVEKAPINLSQVTCASSGLEEASAPMYLTNDRLWDGGR